MRIAFNALSAWQGGGVSVLANLLPCLARIDTKNSYFIFYSPEQSGFARAIPDHFHKVAVKYLPRNPYIRVLWEQLIFPFYLIRNRIDALYSVGNTTSILAPCKVALLIENANPYSLMDIRQSVKERFRNTLLRFLGWLSAWRAIKIRFVSENSKNLIIPQLGVSPDKCVVIPHGISIGSVEKKRTVLNEHQGQSFRRCILTIGANGPHRNTARLLQAFSILVTQYGYGGDLLMLGTTGSPRRQVDIEHTIHDLDLNGRVFLKGEIPHREIESYFRRAEVFLFPSIEETFGIPLLEAMGFGVPVAASDCDLDPSYRGKCFNPFREICGEAAQYFNPFDVEDIAQCVNRMLTAPGLCARLIALGKAQAKKYDLENTARALIQLFDTIVSPH